MNNIFTKRTSFKRGAALLTFVIFFLFASTILVFGFARSAYESILEARMLYEGKRSFFAGEAGLEDAVYRLRDGRAYSNTESFTIDNIPVSVFRVLVVDRYEYTATANARGAARQSMAELVVGDGASFNFGLQSGNGGISLSNNSDIFGNVYSNGVVEGAGNAEIHGDVISAGPSGLVDSLTATGSVWSHSITGSTIAGNAYYYSAGTIAGTSVGGTQNPGAVDQPTTTMPISDELIEEWKDDIANTGTTITAGSPQCLSGTYTVDTNTTLNNVRIQCNVDIKKQGAATTVIFAGPVWIEGNLTFSQGPTIIASSSLGSKSVQIIVDKESNRATSSTVSINQSTTFSSFNSQSYVVLISMNDDAENGGSTIGVDLAQSANGKILVYAPHGRISLGNSTTLKEVTAYQIDINNGAQVIYESGLMNLLFTGGPGGGYEIASWEEI